MIEEDLASITEWMPTAAPEICKLASANGQAVEVLRTSDDSTATALIMALRALYGVDFLYWEPETLWMTLLRDHVLDLSLEDRNRIMAAISIIRNPAFFWDNLVFQRGVKSLCGEMFDPECLLECHPAQMSWAMYEAILLRGMDPDSEARPEVDEDVQQYIAVCLLRAGYVTPPRSLESAEEALLDMLPEENRDFAREVKKSWAHLDKKALSERRFGEDALDVQLAQLASCYLYVNLRAQHMAAEVSRLTSVD
jgi:hypothetical protein